MKNLNDQSGHVGRVLSTADEAFRRTKQEMEAIKIVSQGELGAVRS